MSRIEPGRTAPRRTRTPVRAALVVTGAVLLGILVLPLPASLSTASPFVAVLGDGAGATADGEVPDGTTVHDDHLPAVGNLDGALLDALHDATADAAEDGVRLEVNSGWRSADHQARLFRDAVAEHGSEEEAARWVASPEASAHVSGDAVDIGPVDGRTWLAEHGARFGLCQVYANEPWHFELRPGAAVDGCPTMYADASHDPRTQR